MKVIVKEMNKNVLNQIKRLEAPMKMKFRMSLEETNKKNTYAMINLRCHIRVVFCFF